MTPATQILLSGTLTFGVPLALAMRDLVLLRRSPPGPGWRPEPPAPLPPGPRGDDGGARPARPLPACIIEAARGDPTLRTSRVPELV